MDHIKHSVKKKAIIIGSGVAGLASAIRLAVQGFDVHVYERNSYPGGKLSDFEQMGYHFDAGPSLFTQPQNIEELFTLAEEPIDDYFSYKRLPVSCQYFFDNGKTLTASSEPLELAQAMQEQLDEKPENVTEYLSASERLYKNVGNVFVNHSLHKRKTFFKKEILNALVSARPKHLFGTLHAWNKSKFTSPEAIQIFDRYATYNGSNPYAAPGMLSLIPHLEMNEGTFYPKGGMISITNALYQLALKKGVHFHFNQPVQRIIRDGFVATGIVANHENIFADVIVSNADIYFTYKNLLNAETSAKKILRQERSSSALIFYWGINKIFPQLGLHNIFFSKNYQQEFQHIFKTKTIYNDPTVYINITSKMEEGHAPAGKENWFVMVNVPTNTGQDWATIKQQVKENIITKLNSVLKTDIKKLIETEAIMDPITIESKTASFMGSLYGTSSNSKLAAFFRHPNFSKNIKGLYFVGGSVHPGGGIPLCMKSAKIMAELVRQDSTSKTHH